MLVKVIELQAFGDGFAVGTSSLQTATDGGEVRMGRDPEPSNPEPSNPEASDPEPSDDDSLEPGGHTRKWIALGVLAVLCGLAWKTIEPGRIRTVVLLLLCMFAFRILTVSAPR